MSALFIQEVSVEKFYSFLLNPFLDDGEKSPSLLLVLCLLPAVLATIGEIVGHLLFYLFRNSLFVLYDRLYQRRHQFITFCEALEFPQYTSLHCFDFSYIKCCIFHLPLTLLHKLPYNLRTLLLKIIKPPHHLFQIFLLFLQLSPVSYFLLCYLPMDKIQCFVHGFYTSTPFLESSRH